MHFIPLWKPWQEEEDEEEDEEEEDQDKSIIRVPLPPPIGNTDRQW